ncbi:SDR family NAD(P)-dependent oxidoreductase [Streptomyces sp. NEAU-YJ-81]|uniref:SDR family NAD(P)-dependent oxidoreductase n=1 Tax=Streptomyces sp. NEAU-YJ-81 TaxID=2820288 RepID=UPI001ABC0F41|nr:SDR family oxidoreductase [Streptomyces sp. NEAU-YJ-81]MBO3677441.1 SDR family oxidoreductase [Streptomyces sp. NEAU-YJ-81]
MTDMTAAHFDGTAVIVTGGGTGIGRAAARAFAEQGAQVLVVGRTAARLAETAADAPGIRPLVADVAAPGAAELIVNTALEAFGRIDVLVNNAAVVRQAPLGDIRREAVEEMLAVNLLAPVYLTEAAVPPLSESAGVVINVSTAIGHRGWPMPGTELYAALKAALDTLTRSWAVQLAPRGVRVAGVAPGPIATSIGRHQGLDTEQIDALRTTLIEHVPLRRLGRVEEVAFWITQLARPEAGYTTGVVLPVDGGALVG